MLQDSRLQSIFEVLKVIPREFGIDPLVHELELDEGKKTLISLLQTPPGLVTIFEIKLTKNVNFLKSDLVMTWSNFL